jgi:hypothetical protein
MQAFGQSLICLKYRLKHQIAKKKQEWQLSLIAMAS